MIIAAILDEETLMQIDQNLHKSFTVLTISGDFDIRSAPMFNDCLKELFDKGDFKIIVDLNNVQYFDSSGNGELIFGSQECIKHKGDFMIVSKNENINKIIRTLKIQSVLKLCENVDEALKLARN